MGSFYASVTGTTVLKVKFVPPCPPEYRALVDLETGNESVDGLAEELSEHGTVRSCVELTRSQGHSKDSMWARVRFAEVEEANRAIATLAQQGRRAQFVYNERKFDGEGGRGWTTFEQGVSLTVAAHLASAEMKGQAPKRLLLAQASRPKVIDISDGTAVVPQIPMDPMKVLDSTVHGIRVATFTGKGDQKIVEQLLRSFSDLIHEGLKVWSHAQVRGDSSVSEVGTRGPFMPSPISQVSFPFHLALRLKMAPSALKTRMFRSPPEGRRKMSTRRILGPSSSKRKNLWLASGRDRAHRLVINKRAVWRSRSVLALSKSGEPAAPCMRIRISRCTGLQLGTRNKPHMTHEVVGM